MSNKLSTPNTPELVKRVNSRFKNSPVWSSLFKAVDKVIKTTVTAPREELQTVRDSQLKHRGDWMNLPDGTRGIINSIKVNSPDSTDIFAQVGNNGKVVDVNVTTNLKERQLLINNCVRKGFNYLSDTLTTADYARINDWIEYFWPQSGTDNYYRFIGFVKNMRLESDVLWTDETDDQNSDLRDPGVLGFYPDGTPYNTVETADDFLHDDYPFLEPNYGYGEYKPVWRGGTAYPTSHVQLRFDPLVYPNVNQVDLISLFYLLAPIQLVLRRIVEEVDCDNSFLYTFVTGDMTWFDSGRAKWTFDTYIHNVYFLTMGRMSFYQSGIASLVYESVKDIWVAQPTGISFSNFFREGLDGPQFIDANRYAYRLLVNNESTNQQVALASVDNGRLYFSPDNALVCAIPNSAVAINTTDTYTYRLQRASIASTAHGSILGYRDYFIGSLIVEGETPVQANQQDLLVNLSGGFSFSGIFTDLATGAPLVQDGYEFRIDFIRDDTVTTVIEATNDNGRLYWDGSGFFACYIPAEIAPIIPGIQYSYNLNRKLVTDPDTAYAPYISGLILVENV